MSECSQLERTCALLDGELPAADEAAARAHIATCAECQEVLGDAMQLGALPQPVISLAWYRRRTVQVVGAVLAAAAAVAIYVGTRSHAVDESAPTQQIALASTRAIEARLSWGEARAYRPYDVPRGDEAHEHIAMATLAAVEEKHDLHGVGVLALLGGEKKQAADYLARAGDGADAIADRAALALADKRPDLALGLTDAALAIDPKHTAATWNRGLALRDLGLARGAAVAFRAVADQHEAGWSAEAKTRADALDAEMDATSTRFARLAAASVALASGKVEMTVDDARAEPGYARGILYDAIRSAPNRARLDALLPLAQAIDAADGDHALADAIARAKPDPALAQQYADILKTVSVNARLTAPTGDEKPLPPRAAWLAKLRAAHADDLLMGSMMKLGADNGTVDDPDVAEFAKLAAGSPDPWMQMLGLQQLAQAALRHQDGVAAESVLLRARARCKQGAPVFRCIIVGKLIGQLYVTWQRIPEARAALLDAFASARTHGESFLETEILKLLVYLVVVDSDAEGTNLPLVRAYTDELVRSYPESAGDWRCQVELFGRTERADVLANSWRFAEARRELAGPACAKLDVPAQAAELLFLRAELAQHDGNADEIAAVRRDATELRAALAVDAPERAFVDHAEGRVAIDGDPKAGEALLRKAITEASNLPESAVQQRKPAAWSYAVLATAAAKRGDGAAVLSVLAEEQGLSLPLTCVIGVAIDNQRRAIAARDHNGVLTLVYDEPPALSVDTIPANLVDAACTVIDVIARPPIHGASRILPDAIAWRYLARRAAPLGKTTGDRIAIANVEPPASLDLPRLQTWSADGTQVNGATPARALTMISGASEVIVHAHGLVDVAQPDASYLALSPDADGSFALTTGMVRKAKLFSAPLIILAACRASHAAPIFHETWSLPTAFVYAGARAVVASTAPIPDADASAFFAAVLANVHAGVPVAIALRDARLAWRGGDWVRDVIVFE